MADLKISQLTALVAASVDSVTDVLPIVDSSASETKKITVANLKTAVAPDLSTYAPLASPALTGSPTAPTAAVDTNTTQVATTAYVVGQAYAKLASPTFTGTPTLPTGTIATTQTAGDSTTKVATTAFVTSADNLKANLASPALTGTPTAPTASVDTNTTQVATTAYVVGQGYAKLASPALTGTPTAPTASGGTNTTQIATTAFVTSAVSAVSVDFSSDQNILSNAVFL